MAAKKVIILGGGIAGMSAAHELAERGFDVEVFERKSIPGGKARSIQVQPSQTELGYDSDLARRWAAGTNRSWLPGEHGFRFFPKFYRHVVDTMARIPYRQGFVAGNLVDTTRVQMARFDAPPILLPARFPTTPDDLQVSLSTVLGLLGGSMGVPPDETAFFTGRMWQLLTSCEERRLGEYERIDWWDFIEAETRSDSYQKLYGNAITRSLVAAKAERASARTIGGIFLQIVFDILTPGVSADRLLNGPTNEVWIEPWLDYLKKMGVRYHFGADVTGLKIADGRVVGATVKRNGTQQTIAGDYFIGAMPVEKTVSLLSPDVLKLDPSLKNLEQLTDCVEWMNGIQFFLNQDVPIAHGHSIFVDSPWALTSVSQPQFWPDFPANKFGDPRVHGIVSVDISDWDMPGLNGKRADQCSRLEIAHETWAQMKRSLNRPGQEILRDDMLLHWFLDPAIVDADPSKPGMEENMEPLLVNYTDTWRLRPEAVTRIPNFFLASDYVRTYTDLATMEAANEAARRAVNGIIDASASTAIRCELWNLHEPEAFLPLRAYDRLRYRRALPWDESMQLNRAPSGTPPVTEATPADGSRVRILPG